MSEMMNNVTEIDASEAAYNTAEKVLSDATAQAWVRVGEANNAEKLAMEEAKKAWAVYRTLSDMLSDLIKKKAALDEAKAPQKIEAVVPAAVADEDEEEPNNEIMVCFTIDKDYVEEHLDDIHAAMGGNNEAHQKLLAAIAEHYNLIGLMEVGNFIGEFVT